MYGKNYGIYKLSWASYKPIGDVDVQSLESFCQLSHLLAYNINEATLVSIQSFMMTYDHQKFSHFRSRNKSLYFFNHSEQFRLLSYIPKKIHI